jgi:hypothetical protein
VDLLARPFNRFTSHRVSRIVSVTRMAAGTLSSECVPLFTERHLLRREASDPGLVVSASANA